MRLILNIGLAMRLPLAITVSCAVLIGVSACTALPHPTPADVSRAQTVYPQVTLERLSQARKTYVGACGSCHALHLPTDYPAKRWPALIVEMEQEQRVKLTADQRQQIEEFLVALAN